MRPTPLLIVALPILLAAQFPGSATAGTPLLSVSPRDPVLRQIDSADGSTVQASVTITLPGLTVTGAKGLARHPQTSFLYVLLKIQGRTFPDLAILNEFTGVANTLGNTTDNFASIAFTDDGTLFGLSGDGGIVPESVYTLSTTDASATLVQQLGNGSDGETFAFNPDDGLLYHASGIGNPNQASNGEIFETVDPVTLNVTNVPLSGFDYEELTGLAYLDGDFVAGDLGDADVDMPRFFRITTGGSVTFLGNMDHVAKGFAPVGTPPVVPALPAGALGLLAVALLVALSRPSARTLFRPRARTRRPSH